MARGRNRSEPPFTHAHGASAPARVASLSWLWRAAVVLALVAGVAAIMARKSGRGVAADAATAAPLALAPSHAAPSRTPRLVDVGADRCIPCKAMAPILADLRAEYAGRMQVEFIDVWKNPEAGDPYRVYAIPTQIFFGADGRELGRHQGFISRADILSTWARYGYDFSSPAPAAPQN